MADPLVEHDRRKIGPGLPAELAWDRAVMVLDRHLDTVEVRSVGRDTREGGVNQFVGIAYPVDAKRSIRDQLSEVERDNAGQIQVRCGREVLIARDREANERAV